MQIISFATRGKSFNYRDYSSHIAELESESQKLGIPIKIYSEDFLNSLQLPNAFFRLRKGAGYWIWKPFVIRAGALSTKSRFLLYVDVDLQLLQINQNELIDSLKGNVASVFRMSDNLEEWCSRRAWRILKCQSNIVCNNVASGVILFDTEHPEFDEWLKKWEKHLLNPRLLLDPLFTLKSNHRHDQTILSALICNKILSVSYLPASILIWERKDLDSTQNFTNNSKIIHGRFLDSQPKKRSKILSICFHKFQIAQFWTHLYTSRLKSIIEHFT